jgi:hypothetical protein
MISFLDTLVAPLSLVNALIVATSAKVKGDCSPILKNSKASGKNMGSTKSSIHDAVVIGGGAAGCLPPGGGAARP